MKVSEIVKRVRAAIDELKQSDPTLVYETEDVNNMSRIIIDKIGYALQYVLEMAPLEKLDSSAFETLTAEEIADGFTIDPADDSCLIAKLKLPKDLLRLLDARLSSWSHFPIPESDTSQVFLMQQDKYARGSWDRPVNILTWIGADRYLLMYCAKTRIDTPNLTFIRQPDVSDITEDGQDADVNIPSQLVAALIYQVAGLTMTAFREDLAEALFALANLYLNNEQANRTTE